MTKPTNYESHSLREGLPDLPPRIRRLPIDRRGFPVPWFVAWVEGEPEFRAMDYPKWVEAVRAKLCWVCGEPLGAYMAFVVGPMCAVNRISSEPPSHRECAEFSARACPFLSRPHMRRRENDLPETVRDPAGTMIRRNPGVTLMWITKSYKLVDTGQSTENGPRHLIRMGEPIGVHCYAEGREATPDEIRASVESGLPLLQEVAKKDGFYAMCELDRQTERARALLRIA